MASRCRCLAAAMLLAPVLVLVLATSPGRAAQGPAEPPAQPLKPQITQSAESLRADLGNGTVLRFPLHDGLLLGLQQATVAGMTTKSDQTVLRPVLAQEWGADRMAWPFLKLQSARAVDGHVEIACELLGTTDERACRKLFVFAADRQRAMREGRTPELQALKDKADAAEATIATALTRLPEYQQELASIQTLEDKAAGEKDAAARKKLEAQVSSRRHRGLAELAAKLRPQAVRSTPALITAQQAIDAFEAALAPVAIRLGDIHRDYYRFAHTRQPEEICAVSELTATAAELKASLKPAGTLTWVIEPEERNIAGWRWVGWTLSYRLELPNGRKVNVLHQLGTWEIDGSAVGLTVASLRFRGLGRIEQPLTAGGNGGIREAFSTTEMIPGGSERSMMVSPVVPPALDNKLTDRGYALAHRSAAWICHPARGAGGSFVDFQYRPHAAFVAFPDKQGNLRALTEAFPGDKCLSQTDEEWFALTDRHQTIPMHYLALVDKNTPFTRDESRNRWQEVDQHVRDRVSEELGFVQYEALPGIGLLVEGGWAGLYRDMADKRVDRWADQGVRFITVHNPGWINGRYQGPGGPPKTTGGVCSIYDWAPTKDMEEPWKLFTKACARRGVVYYPWLGQTNVVKAPFVQRVGTDLKHWGLNAPGDTCGAGYEPDHYKGNIFDRKFRDTFVGQIDGLRQDYGLQGFWIDSFQNLFMSQLDWANGTGDSMQRKWWEQLAAWSRQGVGIMAESHSFPGLSCTIEIADWEKDYWYLPHVWRWYRGGTHRNYTGEQLHRTAFRVMANKGWTAPDESPTNIPGFKELADQYMAALPDMRRPYVLGETRGMLWLPYSGDDQGVWFSFSRQLVPEGVTASAILDDKHTAVDAAAEHQTYRVRGKDLPKFFSVRRGPLADPRLGRKYEIPTYTWPAWARDR